MITIRVFWWFVKRSLWLDRVLIALSLMGLLMPPLHVHEPILLWVQVGFAVSNVAMKHGMERPPNVGLFWWVLQSAVFWPLTVYTLIRYVRVFLSKG